ncbi:MAG: hypothetical protein ACWGPN_06340 [Gammaproteobacteria bacterium]
MPYDIKASARGKLIIIRHSGDVVCDEFASILSELKKRIDPFYPPFLLIDVREADSYPDKDDYFQWLNERRRPPPVVDKVAFVTNRVHWDTIECIAMAYINCGLDVRVFCSELDALQWLF